MLIVLLGLSGPAAAGCERSPFGASPARGRGTLSIVYHGVSTLMFDDGHDRILVDGFFTRPRSLLFPHSDPDAVRAALGQGPPLRAILTAHAHHDHALDVATIADQAHDAKIVGTPSVLTLMRRQDVSEEKLCLVQDGDTFQFGAFTVTAYYVEHGPPLPLVGPLLDRPMSRRGGAPIWFGGFSDDKNLAFLIRHGGRRILVQPSAGTRDFTDARADIVFAGVGRLSAQSDDLTLAYLRGLIGTEARSVIPIHWDRFTTPPNEPLAPNRGFFDDVEATFQTICDFAPERPMARFSLMQSFGRIRIEPDMEPSVEAIPLCPRPLGRTTGRSGLMSDLVAVDSPSPEPPQPTRSGF